MPQKPIVPSPADGPHGAPRAQTQTSERLSIATNAAAAALFGVGTGVVEITGEQLEAARTVAERVLDHVDEFDRHGR